jgi:Mce-associated membrane protein
MLTGHMLDQYDRTMAGVGTTSRRDHTVVTATVVDTALVHATTSYARVLVFVNQSTDSDELDQPTLDLDRVLVSLRRVDGDWKVSELDAL